MNSSCGSLRLIIAAVMFGTVTSSCQRTVGPEIRSVVVTDSGSIQFALQWPAGTPGPREALWIFGKYQNQDGAWSHVRVSLPVGRQRMGGLLAEGVADATGFFATRSDTLSTVDVTLPWNPADDLATPARVRMFAIPMVLVDDGPFYAGDGEVALLTGHLQRSGIGTSYLIADENGIVLGMDSGPAMANSGAFGMTDPPDEPFITTANSDDFNDASRILLPAEFPKGTRAFYIMKYELTQGQYADFLNTLSPEQRSARDPDQGRLLSNANGYTVTRGRDYHASIPDRPMNHVSWPDLAAYADWSGLRPMTELEFEKAARGPARPIPGQFSWGTEIIADHRYAFTDARSPKETVSNPDTVRGNASWRATHGTLTTTCSSCTDRPLRGGAFGQDPAVSGESFYGAYELSGNLHEPVVSIGHSIGRAFRGRHGDGIISPEGYAAGIGVRYWPGAQPAGTDFQVTGANGSGLRGGSWASPVERLRISDRALAATPQARRNPTVGIRLVRTQLAIPESVLTPADTTTRP